MTSVCEECEKNLRVVLSSPKDKVCVCGDVNCIVRDMHEEQVKGLDDIAVKYKTEDLVKYIEHLEEVKFGSDDVDYRSKVNELVRAFNKLIQEV